MTHYSIAYGTLSAIDLTVASAELALDHYPTITSVKSSRSSPMQIKRWIMETANWKNYQREVENNLQRENLDISTVTRVMQEVVLNNIKKTTGKPPRKNIKWMTEELRVLIRQRRSAERKLRNHKTDANLTEYHRLKATSRLLLKKGKTGIMAQIH
jgi:hypothetical protein